MICITKLFCQVCMIFQLQKLTNRDDVQFFCVLHCFTCSLIKSFTGMLKIKRKIELYAYFYSLQSLQLKETSILKKIHTDNSCKSICES